MIFDDYRIKDGTSSAGLSTVDDDSESAVENFYYWYFFFFCLPLIVAVAVMVILSTLLYVVEVPRVVSDGYIIYPSLCCGGASGRKSKSKYNYKFNLRFKGLFLYTADILFHVEWFIRQLALVFFYLVP